MYIQIAYITQNYRAIIYKLHNQNKSVKHL